MLLVLKLRYILHAGVLGWKAAGRAGWIRRVLERLSDEQQYPAMQSEEALQINAQTEPCRAGFQSLVRWRR